ncbi:MAG: PilZ domain-containing protein [Nitrospirae bacterium]|nr:PilZ domain-containing protein [Nitrospirota bacterium]
MGKRASERIPVCVDVELDCCHKVRGTVLNISEKGMFISIKEMCFPFDPRIKVGIPFNEDILHVPVKLRRIEMSPDSQDGIGVELAVPSEAYYNLVENLRAAL